MTRTGGHASGGSEVIPKAKVKEKLKRVVCVCVCEEMSCHAFSKTYPPVRCPHTLFVFVCVLVVTS